MRALHAGGTKLREQRERVGGIDGRLGVAPLAQAHHLAVPQIDRRQELDAGQLHRASSRKLPSRRRPASPLFSGWNCVPSTRPTPATAAKRRPWRAVASCRLAGAPSRGRSCARSRRTRRRRGRRAADGRRAGAGGSNRCAAAGPTPAGGSPGPATAPGRRWRRTPRCPRRGVENRRRCRAARPRRRARRAAPTRARRAGPRAAGRKAPTPGSSSTRAAAIRCGSAVTSASAPTQARARARLPRLPTPRSTTVATARASARPSFMRSAFPWCSVLRGRHDAPPPGAAPAPPP